MALTLGVLREVGENEQRVALVPDVVEKFRKLGCEVVIEAGAGDGALIPDAAWGEAEVAANADTVLQKADVLLTVQPPPATTLQRLRDEASVLGYLAPHQSDEAIEQLLKGKQTAFSMELVPRITRAQSMDSLSSQAAVAGYKAVLVAALESGKFFPMLTTAAGTIRPSTVLVIGAGVAGLQALATARRLGAITIGYDVRPETKEQVESLGAKFLQLSISAVGDGGYARQLTDEEKQQQQDELAEHLSKMNVVITTAAIPGRPAPKIITTTMVEGMPAGSVIVDIAAETGGNCELTEAGETVEHGGVRIVGPVNLPSSAAMDASDMYARNLYNFLSPFIEEGELKLDWDDEVLTSSAVTRDGKIVHKATRERLGEDEEE